MQDDEQPDPSPQPATGGDASSGSGRTAEPSMPAATEAGQDPPATDAPAAARQDAVEYVVSCDAASGAVTRIEKLSGGERTELTPEEYGALLYAYGMYDATPGDFANDYAQAALAADPYGLLGTPTPAAVAGSGLSPELLAYYQGYSNGYLQMLGAYGRGY